MDLVVSTLGQSPLMMDFSLSFFLFPLGFRFSCSASGSAASTSGFLYPCAIHVVDGPFLRPFLLSEVLKRPRQASRWCRRLLIARRRLPTIIGRREWKRPSRQWRWVAPVRPVCSLPDPIDSHGDVEDEWICDERERDLLLFAPSRVLGLFRNERKSS